MNKEMITRRAFAGLAAGGAASTLAACNSDVLQAILNPDSVLWWSWSRSSEWRSRRYWGYAFSVRFCEA